MVGKSSRFGNLFIGVLLGGLIGVVVVLLAAPQSGVQTRTMLRDKGIELKNRANSTVQDTRTLAGDAISKVRSRTGDLASRFGLRTTQSSEEKEAILE